MNRRDFNRLAVGAGLGSVTSNRRSPRCRQRRFKVRPQRRHLKVLLLRILRALITKSPYLENIQQERGGSAFTGPGVIPGNRTEICPKWTIASRR